MGKARGRESQGSCRFDPPRTQPSCMRPNLKRCPISPAGRDKWTHAGQRARIHTRALCECACLLSHTPDSLHPPQERTLTFRVLSNHLLPASLFSSLWPPTRARWRPRHPAPRAPAAWSPKGDVVPARAIPRNLGQALLWSHGRVVVSAKAESGGSTTRISLTPTQSWPQCPGEAPRHPRAGVCQGRWTGIALAPGSRCQCPSLQRTGGSSPLKSESQAGPGGRGGCSQSLGPHHTAREA